LARPDFRALAAVRLGAERSERLSPDVLRLLSPDDAAAIQREEIEDEIEDVALDEIDCGLREAPEDQVDLDAVEPDAGGTAAEEACADDLPLDETLTDTVTGLASAWVWRQVLGNEQNRFARRGRPVTLVAAELDGIDALAAWFGQDVADRLISPLAAMMRRSTRGSDVMARTGRTRFVAMLSETDETAAANYVRRVRSECDAWLESSGLAVRLVIGWAQPVAGGLLTDALRLADERLRADRRSRDFYSTALRSKTSPSGAGVAPNVERAGRS
jgi:diguanylate cyclase (GGDEF)-like protein